MSALTATTAPCMTWGGGEGDQGDDQQGSDREGDRRPAELDSSGGHSRHDPAAPAAPQTRLGARYDALQDQQGRTPRRRRIPVKVIERLCRLRRESYADFSIQHFWEKATEEHGFELSYTWTRLVLQAAGLAPKAPGRGRYRRKRERRPLIGMLVHLDGSTHTWIPDLPQHDLIVALDDADGRMLYGRFWAQESTASTLNAKGGH